MLETIDKQKVFNREDSKMPLLLLDGHHSRLSVPFLRYIRNDDHRWKIAIGVPYGTHVWKVGDSSQLNGSFKVEFYRAKRNYLVDKDEDDKKFSPTDIMPLINTAWDKSFARIDKAKQAIVERGWNPLNYVLLDHPKVVKLPDTSIPDSIPVAILNDLDDDDSDDDSLLDDNTCVDESRTVNNTITSTVSGNATVLQINLEGKKTKNILRHYDREWLN